jgi:hypothetical protein
MRGGSHVGCLECGCILAIYASVQYPSWGRALCVCMHHEGLDTHTHPFTHQLAVENHHPAGARASATSSGSSSFLVASSLHLQQVSFSFVRHCLWPHSFLSPSSFLDFVVPILGHSQLAFSWLPPPHICSAPPPPPHTHTGMLSNGTAMFTYAGLFGTLAPYEARPWSNRIAWDASSCCNPNTNQGWALLRTLFGWAGEQRGNACLPSHIRMESRSSGTPKFTHAQPSPAQLYNTHTRPTPPFFCLAAEPTNLQVLYYFMYLGLMIVLLVYRAWKGTLTDAKKAMLADQESMLRHSECTCNAFGCWLGCRGVGIKIG